MTDREKIITDAINELTELAHEETMESDEDYAKKQHRLSVQSGILSSIQKKLTADENKRLAEFRELESELTGRQIQASYIRGAKDCVALLKKLGVI